MDYATNYDVGEQKRDRGINEDSVALAVFEQGHRDGVSPADRESDHRERSNRGGGAAAASASSEPADSDEAEPAAARQPANRSAAVVVLADGAGGHEAGDVASYLATTVVCERLAETAIRASRSDPTAFDIDVRDPLPPMQTATELREAVGAAIEAAHRAILAYAGETRQAAYSTVVAGLVVDGTFHYAWVGDSRAYVCNREHETIERLTADHGVVARLAEAGEIDDVEAMVHPRTNEITRALGGTGPPVDGEATVEVDTNSVDLYGDDVVLLTSDGLVDAQTDAQALYDEYLERDRETAVADEVREAVVTDAEIRETILTADTLDTAATDLVGLANGRGGKDNISTLLLGDPVLPAAPPDPPARDVREVPPVGDRDTLLISEG
jgi:serine/threonine protein phosphatase PrpC